MTSLNGEEALPLASLNHISIVCSSVQKSLDFYQNVLGFVPVRRPRSLNFEGAWLFNYGIGIHLLKSEEHAVKTREKKEIIPRDNHISFQCSSIQEVEKKLQYMGCPYIKRMVEDEGIYVDQLFFHDPDGFMIEICNCENLPITTINNIPRHG